MAGTGSETDIVCLKHMDRHFEFRICHRANISGAAEGDVCEGHKQHGAAWCTSIVTYCSRAMAPQSSSFFFLPLLFLPPPAFFLAGILAC